MCGIVGYTGRRAAAPLIMEGLKRLEYRGYDSAGLAVVRAGRLEIDKAAGKLAVLASQLPSDGHTGTLALGHTRWATHGAPSDVNAHPHTDTDGTIAVVHNGIIENAAALRAWLSERGCRFLSETDTEVLAHLISELYTDSLEAAVAETLRRVEGTYGLGVISTHEPNTLVAARLGSPLLLALGDGENFIASDAAAVVQHTRSVVYLDDGEVAVLTPDNYHIVDLDKMRVEKTV